MNLRVNSTDNATACRKLILFLIHFPQSNVTPFGKQYWTDSVSESPPTVQYEAIMNGDGAVLEWLENVVSLLIPHPRRT